MSKQGSFEEFELGIRPGATWHTAVELDAGSKCKLTSGPVLRQMREKTVDPCAGYDFSRRHVLGRINQEFAISGPLRYEGSMWVPIIQNVGTEAGTVATGVYTHTVDVDIEQKTFFTAAAIIRDTTLASSEVFEWPSVMCTNWEITTGGDGFMQFNVNGIADTLLDTGEGNLVNTYTTVGTTSTVDSDALEIPFGHCRVNINDQSGADFNSSGDGTDRIYPIAVSISSSRPLVRDFDANRVAADTGSDADAYKTNTPFQNGRYEDIFVTFEFSETDSNDYIEELRDNTAKKAEVYFYYSDSRYLKFQFPNLLYTEIDAQASGVGRIPQIVTFRAAEVSDGTTAPNGMDSAPGITKPYRMTLVNSWAKQYDDHSAIT